MDDSASACSTNRSGGSATRRSLSTNSDGVLTSITAVTPSDYNSTSHINYGNASRRRSSVASTGTNGTTVPKMPQEERRRLIKEIMADPKLSQKEKSLSIQSLMDGRRRSSCGASHASSLDGSVTNSSAGGGHGFIGLDDYSNHNRNSNYNRNSSINTSGHIEDGSIHYVNSMARAAAMAAAYYSSDDDEGDATMYSDHDDDNGCGDQTDYDYNDFDAKAIAPDNFSDGYDLSVCGRSVGSTGAHSKAESSYSSGAGGVDYVGYFPDNHLNYSHNHLDVAPSGTGGGGYRKYHGRSMSLQDWTDGDRAVAQTVANNVIPNPKIISRLLEQSRPACTHYERNCTIISPCCGLAFGCRICHDDCPVLPPPLSLRGTRKARFDTDGAPVQKVQSNATTTGRRHSMPLDFNEKLLEITTEQETHHLIDRFAIREVICRHCYERQSSKT